MIPRNNSPPATTSHVSREECNRCMKNSTTRIDLTPAIPSATGTSSAPSSAPERKYVVSVSTRSPPKTRKYVAGFVVGCVMAPPSMTQQVQQRKHEDPHDIDKVPVQPRQLDGRVVADAERGSRHQHQLNAQHSQADQHVQGVQARDGEVEEEEHLHPPRHVAGHRHLLAPVVLDLPGAAVVVLQELPAGHQLLLVFVVPLPHLD